METPLSPLEFARRTRRLHGGRLAVVDGELRLTYEQFFDRVDRWSAVLQGLGVRQGDRVATIAPNTHAQLEAFYAVPQLGGVLVPLNYRLTGDDFVYMINHSGSSVVCVHADYLDLVDGVRDQMPGVRHFVAFEGGPRGGWLDYEAAVAAAEPSFAKPGNSPAHHPNQLPTISERDLLTINYTSGTTSRPKGVMITHRNAALNTIGTLLHLPIPVGEPYLWTLPMFHANGWTFTWTVTAAAGTHVCLRKVDPAAIFPLIRNEHVRRLCAAPTVCISLANASPEIRGEVPAGVRVITAGAPPAAATIERLEGELGWEVTQAYGLTETAPFITVCAPLPEHEALSPADRAVIKARQGVELLTSGELRVVDEKGTEVPADGITLGEITVRGNVVMQGYYNDPEATRRAMGDGWFRTGDAAVVHPDGYVEIRDRIKDVIISGGENISSVEVEGALLRHPAVDEAAIVGLPSEEWGETPHAFVVLRPGASATEGELREFLRDRIAHFKVPSGVTFVAELPKTATGKIQKFVLRSGGANISRQLPAWQGNRCVPAGSPPRCVHLRFLPSCDMSDSHSEEVQAKPRFSRRVFIVGAAGAGAAAGLSRGGFAPAAQAATAPSGPPTTTLPLPTTTSPEQLLLTWGNDPATEVTVSWAAPGSVPQPAPTLAYSTQPITKHNPGKLIQLPHPEPLDVSKRYADAAAVSFTDGLNGQTVYHYHAQLKGLRPGTRYYYEVSDGGHTPAVAGAAFTTAPFGRAPFRFSSYGDLSTPSWDLNASGNIWHESCDNSWYAVTAIENPGDGKGAPLFHLLNGDLCYANLDIENAPSVWRDFGINVARSSANRPWLPALGNHETEFGTYSHAGKAGTAPGGIAAQGAAGNYWNGPYGYGHYLTKFLLPDNGLVNYDGNRLRGNFYAFQVGTVLFLSLDADDVIYQDGASAYLSGTPDAAPETTSSGAAIPNGTVTYNRFYTGDLKPESKNNSLVPDFSKGRPNLQTLWLEETLAKARHNSSVDMIVVIMHQCAMSTSVPGNGSDLGIRQAWLPLFDRYEVDLVLSGHEHDYERTYPVRGYDAGELGTVVSPNPDQVKGAAVDTRRPKVAAGEPYDYKGQEAWNTTEGTVFLVLGGGGTNGPTNTYGHDAVADEPQAKVITERNAISGSQATGFSRNSADSIEDAPWSAAINASDAYGYGIFDVDPGQRPGDTTITFQYFAVPAVSNESGTAHDGTTTLPHIPVETMVFGRKVGKKRA
jgi:fatty-acyl-CoA synthase